MKTLVAIIIAFLTGMAVVPKPAPPLVEERFLTEQEDYFLRNMCSDGGCAIVPNPVWNDMRLKAEKCRA